MKQKFVSVAVLIASAALTGCVDDKYDLSDIDTTSKFAVNDLTIPVKMDPFTLSSMFDLNEEDPEERVKIINGSYAIVQGGSFTSSQIHFKSIHLEGIPGATISAPLNIGFAGQLPAGREVSFDIASAPVGLSYSTTSVPEEIMSISRVGGSFSMDFYLEIPELAGVANAVTVKNLTVKFPAGLDAVAETGTYTKSDGLLTVPPMKINGTRLTLKLNCTGLDFALLKGSFNPATHVASLSEQIAIKSGTVMINGNDVSGNIPASLSLRTGNNISDILVTSFTGEIKYDIENVNIDPVSLADLPDILQQPETRINIMNPQIYLKIDNPLSKYTLKARTGLTIVSDFDRDGTLTQTTHSLDDPYFEVGSAPSNYYYLSPAPVASDMLLNGYSGATHVGFKSLSSVLEGNGLPSRLNISLNNPNIFTQPVEELPLGVDLGIVNGKYDFCAPLAFGAKSKVVYTKQVDGWNDEDVDAITIETLKVTTTVTSHVPFDLSFTGYPVDVNGKQINGVTIEGAKVPAGATNLPVEIRITGKVEHLDGIIFTATGFVPEDMSAPLSPKQSIDCKELRAVVSGYYIKEL